MTNSLSGIQHAWHFWYTADFGVEVPCGSLVIACFIPLTGRYTLYEK
ncbi:DUF3265 domain-containing protein [Vibrio campbellii]|nr:DUF3265 domain-containing protein [Vibrio campbellii]